MPPSARERADEAEARAAAAVPDARRRALLTSSWLADFEEGERQQVCASFGLVGLEAIELRVKAELAELRADACENGWLDPWNRWPTGINDRGRYMFDGFAGTHDAALDRATTAAE